MRRVLLIDDEPRAARALEYALSGTDLHIHAINNSAGLAQVSADEQPDIILLDIALGADNGLDVCRRLRADDRFRGTPVLLLSGQTDAATKRAGLEAGADDFVSKPFVPEELLARMDHHIRRRQGV